MLKITVFVFVYSIGRVLGADWCYQSQVTCNDTCIGPGDWTLASQMCSGRVQSPVNVVTRNALPDETLVPFEFIGYQETFHGLITNTGHSVQVDLPTSATIRGGNLPVPYKALQLHLHWGTDGEAGSEHTVDGERFPMEMHIVHIKEEYDTLSQAVEDPRGVAVLALFFQESATPNKQYDSMISALKELKRPSANSTLSGMSLDALLPPRSNRTRYFRYQGSLTTPPCAEAVSWTLFQDPVLLGRKQLSAFSQLQFANGMRMVNTYRPLQKLNMRVVHYSGGYSALASIMLIISSLLLSSEVSLQSM